MPIDKIAHATGTGFLAAFGALLLTVLGAAPDNALIYAVTAALVIGALKELVWDGLMRRGQPEMADMIANFAGAAPVAALIPFV